MAGAKPGGKTAGPAHSASGAAPGLAAREAAHAVLAAILDEGALMEQALARNEARLAALAPRDRAFARALVATALRRLGQIDDALARFLSRRLPPRAGAARAILRLGAAQILFLDVPAHAAVDLAVRMAKADPKARHFAALVNGVLRRLAEAREAILAAQDAPALNLPAWLARRWRAAYGADHARRIGEAILHEPALDLTVKADPDAWAERLGGIVLPTGSVRLLADGPIEALAGYETGAWWVQDAAAALPARLFGPLAGRALADLCAAPGGKTAALAAAGARVTAVDRSSRRLERLGANLARLGLSAEIVAADLETWEPPAAFDAILLDAPCTASGTARRHPDMLAATSERDVSRFCALQARLLRRAADWLKPGGTLVYATCSLEPEEGEQVVAGFLAERPDFARAPIEAAEIAGLSECLTPLGELRSLPFHLPGPSPRLSGMDGFYAARLARR